MTTAAAALMGAVINTETSETSAYIFDMVGKAHLLLAFQSLRDLSQVPRQVPFREPLLQVAL